MASIVRNPCPAPEVCVDVILLLLPVVWKAGRLLLAGVGPLLELELGVAVGESPPPLWSARGTSSGGSLGNTCVQVGHELPEARSQTNVRNCRRVQHLGRAFDDLYFGACILVHWRFCGAVELAEPLSAILLTPNRWGGL